MDGHKALGSQRGGRYARQLATRLGTLPKLWMIVVALLFAGNEVIQGAPVSDPPESEVLRPVTDSWMLSAGWSRLTDTYLTPLRYKGWGTALSYDRAQAMKFAPGNWMQRLFVGLQFDNAQNPARNASMLNLELAASWGMQRRFTLPAGITAAVGPQVRADVGVLYNRRNSNNPASAKADITVGAEGSLTYGFRIGRMPVTARYVTSLPVTGVFFSPDYDELYYEIYLGNHSGLAHAAWWGNFFRWDNQITFDLDFSANKLRVGFSYNMLSTKVNHITSFIGNAAFLIGVTTDWFAMPRRKLPPADTNIYFAY